MYNNHTRWNEPITLQQSIAVTNSLTSFKNNIKWHCFVYKNISWSIKVYFIFGLTYATIQIDSYNIIQPSYNKKSLQSLLVIYSEPKYMRKCNIWCKIEYLPSLWPQIRFLGSSWWRPRSWYRSGRPQPRCWRARSTAHQQLLGYLQQHPSLIPNQSLKSFTIMPRRMRFEPTTLKPIAKSHYFTFFIKQYKM